MPLDQRWELRIRAGATSRLARSLGVSRAGLARLAGLSESTLYRVDVGERPGNQTLAALLRLATISEVPFEEIVELFSSDRRG